MTLPTDYVDGDVLTAADVNAITTAVNTNTNSKIAVTTIAAKGDLLVGLTNDSVGVLSVGTNGYVLKADSAEASGLKWESAGGKCLQIASDYVGTSQSTTSTSAVDIPGVSITFTPLSSSSKIVLELTGHASVYISSGTQAARVGAVYTSEGGIVFLGQYISPSESDTDAIQNAYISRVVITNTNTTPRTYTGKFQALSGCTIELQNGITFTATEYAT